MTSIGAGIWRRAAEEFALMRCHVCLRWRVFAYLVPWLGVVAAFFFFLFPQSPNEGDGSPLKQALTLPLWTPLLATAGLAHSVGWSDFPGPAAACVAALGLLVHAIVMLTQRRLTPLLSLLALQLLLLGIGVAGFVHLSKLPTGG